jgi:hypothetical protein
VTSAVKFFSFTDFFLSPPIFCLLHLLSIDYCHYYIYYHYYYTIMHHTTFSSNNSVDSSNASTNKQMFHCFPQSG